MQFIIAVEKDRDTAQEQKDDYCTHANASTYIFSLAKIEDWTVLNLLRTVYVFVRRPRILRLDAM